MFDKYLLLFTYMAALAWNFIYRGARQDWERTKETIPVWNQFGFDNQNQRKHFGRMLAQHFLQSKDAQIKSVNIEEHMQNLTC